MRFLLGLLLSLIAACGLLVAGFALLSTWKGPKKTTAPKAPPILLPKEVQADIRPLPPLSPPARVPRLPLASNPVPEDLLPFEVEVPTGNSTRRLILATLPPSPLKVRVLEANGSKLTGRLPKACYEVRGFDEHWERLFTVDRFCMKAGARLDPRSFQGSKRPKKAQ